MRYSLKTNKKEENKQETKNVKDVAVATICLAKWLWPTGSHVHQIIKMPLLFCLAKEAGERRQEWVNSIYHDTLLLASISLFSTIILIFKNYLIDFKISYTVMGFIIKFLNICVILFYSFVYIATPPSPAWPPLYHLLVLVLLQIVSSSAFFSFF